MVCNHSVDYDPAQEFRVDPVVVALGFYSGLHCFVPTDYRRDMVLEGKVYGQEDIQGGSQVQDEYSLEEKNMDAIVAMKTVHASCVFHECVGAIMNGMTVHPDCEDCGYERIMYPEKCMSAIETFLAKHPELNEVE